MRRQRALLQFALGSLGRRRGRAVGLSLGLAFTVGLFSSVWMLSQALSAELDRHVGSAPDLTVQRVRAGRPDTLKADALPTLRALPGVRHAWARVWGYVYLGALDANLTVVGVSPERAARVRKRGAVTVAPGAPDAPTGDQMWLGAELARRLEVGLGDRIALPGAEAPEVLQVSGLFREASALRTADVVLVETATARRLLDLAPDEATDLALDLAQPREAPLLAEKIQRALPGRQRVLEKSQLRRAYRQSFGARSGLLMAGLLPALASLLLIAFDRLSALSEAERREIGVLRAAGFATADVLTVRMWESLAMSVAGTTIGLLCAYGFVFGLDAPALRSILLGYSTLYPPLSLPPQLDAGQALSIVALVSVPFSAVSLIPAWRAAALDPAQALRGGT